MIQEAGDVLNTERVREELTGKSALEVLRWIADEAKGKVAFASSLGAEDQVILDMISRDGLDIPVFTLDTGRLFPEAYQLIAASEEKYGIRMRIYFPDAAAVETMVAEKGVDLFYQSVENRKQCCRVRKLAPLARALSARKAWVCGLRREQSVTRTDISVADWDAMHGMIKVNPLVDWSEAQVWDYIHEHSVPYNPLHDQGFLSIGCACCTRAVQPGEDVRAGRWWWEEPEQKECGLHLVNGKLQRIKQD